MMNDVIINDTLSFLNELYGFDVSKLDARQKQRADEILERKLYAEVKANTKSGLRSGMTPEERKIFELEGRLLRAKLEMVNREIEAFDMSYSSKIRNRESKHASSRNNSTRR
ncbi:hypothetical protein RAC89_23095 [Paenibacillus sp. GD4]|uniref:hypothetical protein n=1 Tax=Paenibacillus sp. GD4 TaxID=3068890 RepID=UPI002796BD4E|nr:hypothetical protein [Paenibacillus sp. GD4]MDQ1913287.1 hypothetical protein [Paenibacillus sp. GD4]